MSAWVPPAAWWPGGRGGWRPWLGGARRTRGATPEPAALRTPPHTPLGTRGQASAFFIYHSYEQTFVESCQSAIVPLIQPPILHYIFWRETYPLNKYFMTNWTSLKWTSISKIPWQSRRQWSEPSSAARWTLGWPQCQSPRWPRQQWQPRPRPAERGPHPPSRKTWSSILQTSISKTSNHSIEDYPYLFWLFHSLSPCLSSITTLSSSVSLISDLETADKIETLLH